MGQENNFEIPALMPIEQGEIKSRKIQSNVTLDIIDEFKKVVISRYFFLFGIRLLVYNPGKNSVFYRDFAGIEIMICFKRS